MDRFERIEMVTNTIDSSVKHACIEYEISACEMIGILEIIKLGIYESTEII